MANPQIIYADVTSYNFQFLSASNQDASYPLTNLNNYYLNEEWRGATTSTQYLSWDFGEAKECDSIVIDNHNLDVLGVAGTVSLQAADNSSFTSATTVVVDLVDSAQPKVVQFSSTTKRFWRIVCSGSLGEQPRIGQLFVEKALEFTTPYSFGYKAGNTRYETFEATTLTGRVRSSQVFGGRNVYELKFLLQDETLREHYLDFQQTIKGKVRPFYFIDTDGTTYRFKQDSDYSPIVGKAPSLNNIEAITFKTEGTS